MRYSELLLHTLIVAVLTAPSPSFATIDYMIHAYGPYSASATGGNGFARDFLAGIATFYATPRQSNNFRHLLTVC